MSSYQLPKINKKRPKSQKRPKRIGEDLNLPKKERMPGKKPALRTTYDYLDAVLNSHRATGTVAEYVPGTPSRVKFITFFYFTFKICSIIFILFIYVLTCVRTLFYTCFCHAYSIRVRIHA